MIVRLTKALYGCAESARLWYNDISKTLVQDGFTCNEKDNCVFNKVVGGEQITVCLYVDDMFITCKDLKHIKELCTKLEEKYDGITYQIDAKLKYLGMNMDFSTEGQVSFCMPKIINDIIDESGVEGTACSPAANDLFVTKPTDVRLSEEDSKKFHSLVMKLQYVSKRVRPDFLLAVVYLSTRVLCSTDRDLRKLMRLLKYLNGTKDLVLTVRPSDGFLEILTFVDASFAVHPDMRSHTGCIITFGAGGIYFKSSKQKLNSKSSTEAELIGLSESLNTVIWLRDFLISQGYDMGPAVIYQDNMSTITMIENGSGSNERTRYINIKFFFAHDRAKKGEITIKHMPTDDMLADFLTKPLQGEKFRMMRSKLLNM